MHKQAMDCDNSHSNLKKKLDREHQIYLVTSHSWVPEPLKT